MSFKACTLQESTAHIRSHALTLEHTVDIANNGVEAAGVYVQFLRSRADSFAEGAGRSKLIGVGVAAMELDVFDGRCHTARPSGKTIGKLTVLQKNQACASTW